MRKNIVLICLALAGLSLACSLITPPITPQKDNVQQARAVVRVESMTQETIPAKMPTKAPQKPTEAPNTPKPNICSVLAQNLHLRAFPGVEAPVIDYLHAGDLLTLTQAAPAGVWYQVTTQGGLTGWVNSTFTNCRKDNQ